MKINSAKRIDASNSHFLLIRASAIRVALLMVVCIDLLAATTSSARALQNKSVETAINASQASRVSLRFGGTINFPAGIPLQPILVDVYQGKLPTYQTELFLTMQSVDGEFHFESDRIGPMTIHARTEDSNFQSVEHSTVNRLLELSQGKIPMRMEKARTVELKVVDRDLPVAEASVLLVTRESLPFIGRTDRSGMAEIRVPKSSLVTNIRAHTSDSRLASLNIFSERSESQLADEYLLSLIPCTKHKIIASDPIGKPMPNLPLIFRCADNNDRWILWNGLMESTTDPQGETTFDYRPLLPKGRTLIRIQSDDYFVRDFKEKTESITEIKVLPYSARQEVDCKIELPEGSPAGLIVHGSSFESAEEFMNTQFYSRIDQNGSFKAKVVPGYTYNVNVEDALWVSSPWHGIILEEKSGLLNTPSLSISKGIPVEITVTTGEFRRPLANQSIRAFSPHQFKWKDRLSGEIKRGSVGVAREATTDSSGTAVVITTPGELQAHLMNGSQYTEGKVDVSLGQPATLALHLAIDCKTELSGRVKLPVGTSAKLENFQVRFEQADSIIIHPKIETTCDTVGRFKSSIEASRVMIYAESNDKEFSGAMVTQSDQPNIELLVARTAGIDGRLLNETGSPRVGCKVWASASIRNNAPLKSASRGFLTTDTIKVGYWEVLTDSQGNFSFRGLPTNLRVVVGVETKGQESVEVIEDDVLEAGEVRTIEPVRVNPKPNHEATPLVDRFATLVQTNRLLHTRAMVVVSGGGDSAKRFVDDHVLDIDEHPDVYWYIPMSLSMATVNEQPTDRAVSNEKSWTLEDAEKVLVVAYDNQGAEIGRLRIDTTKANHEAESVNSYEQFLVTHKPPQEDAEEKLDRALTEAKATNRRVWVVCSGTRCGPCRRMARWMDGQHALLNKAVVRVHMAKVLRRLNVPQGGIPWHAILDADGNILINNETEILGNIGGPDKSTETMKHFRKMIELAGKGQLTDKEVGSLAELVKNY